MVLVLRVTAVSMEYFISGALFTSSLTQTNNQSKAKRNKAKRLALATSVVLEIFVVHDQECYNVISQ